MGTPEAGRRTTSLPEMQKSLLEPSSTVGPGEQQTVAEPRKKIMQQYDDISQQMMPLRAKSDALNFRAAGTALQPELK
jgi:hypothetical protein